MLTDRPASAADREIAVILSGLNIRRLSLQLECSRSLQLRFVVDLPQDSRLNSSIGTTNRRNKQRKELTK